MLLLKYQVIWTFQNVRMITKSFITSKVGYYSLIWIFDSRGLNNNINSIHESPLRLAYSDSKSIFEEFLNKDNSASIDHIDLQVLPTEMFKIKENMTPELEI